MFKQFVSVGQWITLSQEARRKIAEALKIPRSGYAQVEQRPDGCHLITDGHRQEDLDVLTVEKLQAFTNTQETDLYRLFEKAIGQIMHPELKKPEEAAKEFLEAERIVPPAKKRGRPAKKQLQ